MMTILIWLAAFAFALVGLYCAVIAYVFLRELIEADADDGPEDNWINEGNVRR